MVYDALCILNFTDENHLLPQILSPPCPTNDIATRYHVDWALTDIGLLFVDLSKVHKINELTNKLKAKKYSANEPEAPWI